MPINTFTPPLLQQLELHQPTNQPKVFIAKLPLENSLHKAMEMEQQYVTTDRAGAYSRGRTRARAEGHPEFEQPREEPYCAVPSTSMPSWSTATWFISRGSQVIQSAQKCRMNSHIW